MPHGCVFGVKSHGHGQPAAGATWVRKIVRKYPLETEKMFCFVFCLKVGNFSFCRGTPGCNPRNRHHWKQPIEFKRIFILQMGGKRGGGRRIVEPAAEEGQDRGSLSFPAVGPGPLLYCRGCILPRGLRRAGSVPPTPPCRPQLSSIRNGKSRSQPQTESEPA